MRLVERRDNLRPAALDGPGSIGEKERARVLAFYKAHPPPPYPPVVAAPARTRAKAGKGGAGKKPKKAKKSKDESFTYEAYTHESIKRALHDLFHGKCAYCECVYSANAPMDVEHYRPKGGVEVGGVLVKPGYYWLAAEWTNLLPSCIDCNRRRYHTFEGEGEWQRGKENLFPLAPGSPFARRPGDEKKEKPLLLNPCDVGDPPEKHLEFLCEATDPDPLPEGAAKDKRGVVRARGGSPRGLASISVYGLDRPALVDLRRDVATELLAVIIKLKEEEVALAANPADPRLLRWVQISMSQLAQKTRARAPFAAMARELTLRFYGKKVWKD